MRWILLCCLALPLIAAEPLALKDLLESARFLKNQQLCEAAVPIYQRALQHDDLKQAQRRTVLQELADCQLMMGDTNGATASLEQVKMLVADTEPPKVVEPEPAADQTPQLRDALRRIILPELKVEVGTPVKELIARLSILSKEHDPAGEGVSLLWVDSPLVPDGAPAELGEFDFGEEEVVIEEEEAAPAPAPTTLEIHSPLQLRHIALADVLDILRVLGICHHKLQNGAVLLGPPDHSFLPMETRFYPVDPGWLVWAKEESGDESFDLQAFMRSFGVNFPAGSKASLDTRVGKLVIYNTLDNLERAETLLRETTPPPPLQVSVTAEVIDIQLPDELQDLSPAHVTGKDLAALPLELQRRLSRVTIVTREDAELPASADGSTTLTIDSLAIAGQYEIYLNITWEMPAARVPDRDSPYRIKTDLLLWDGEVLALQLDHLDGRDRFLIIRATLITPIGLPLRP